MLFSVKIEFYEIYDECPVEEIEYLIVSAKNYTEAAKKIEDAYIDIKTFSIAAISEDGFLVLAEENEELFNKVLNSLKF